MSDSEAFESAKDGDHEESEEDSSSDDEPLVSSSKKSASPKKSGKKSPSKSPKGKKGKKNDKAKNDDKNKKGRVSFSLVPVSKGSGDKSDEEEEYEVEAIVGHREYNGKLMYKIRWKNYSAVDDTWESHGSLSCPDLLEAYNLKHNVVVTKSLARNSKRKTPRGRKKKNPTSAKKRRSSLDETDDDDDEEVKYDDASEDGEEYEVDKIIQIRYKKDGSREFLVHWKRWSSQYDTWEPESNLSCPDLIEKFMKTVEDSKNLNHKELRAHRKHTQRFTLNTHDSGRRLSKRNTKKMRVTYYGDEDGSDVEV